MGSEQHPIPAFPPGEFLDDECRHRGWTWADLARRALTTEDRIEGVIHGTLVIDAALAEGIGKAFGTSAALWVNLQATYSQFLLDLDEAHAAELTRTVHEKDAEIARLRDALEECVDHLDGRFGVPSGLIRNARKALEGKA